MNSNNLRTMLALMALGSWGKTHTPPNDDSAPDPVGNQGELTIQIDGEENRYLVDSAKLHKDRAPYLSVRGESVGGEPVFFLHLDSPHSKVPTDFSKLSHVSLPLSSVSRSWLNDGTDERIAISGGSLRILQVTGSGPWEIDAELEFETALGGLSGALSTKVLP
jgi:hypothetical protein